MDTHQSVGQMAINGSHVADWSDCGGFTIPVRKGDFLSFSANVGSTPQVTAIVFFVAWE